MIRKIVQAVFGDTWFCWYCSAPFGSEVELSAHLASCGYRK